jgi:hypothetical protein
MMSEIAANARSYTGRYLKPVLKRRSAKGAARPSRCGGRGVITADVR